MPISTPGTSIKLPSLRSVAVSWASPAPKSPLPWEISLMPSLVPIGTYRIWAAGLRLLYSCPHLVYRGAGTLDPDPTTTTASCAKPSGCDTAKTMVSASPTSKPPDRPEFLSQALATESFALVFITGLPALSATPDYGAAPANSTQIKTTPK